MPYERPCCNEDDCAEYVSINRPAFPVVTVIKLFSFVFIGRITQVVLRIKSLLLNRDFLPIN